MSKPIAWHSIKLGQPMVFHDDNTCTLGDNIEARYRVEGRGIGRHRCKECETSVHPRLTPWGGI